MIINNDGLTADQIMRAVPSVFASEPHESRSSRYLYIPTGDILAGLYKEGFVPTSVMQARSRREDRKAYTKHLIRLRTMNDLGSNHPDVHEIVLVNSHDGSSSYQLMSGIFRMVCSNGSIVGNFDDTLKVLHKGNLLDNVIEGTVRIVEGSAKVMGIVEEMKDIPLSQDEKMLLSEYVMKARFEGDNEDEQPKAVVPYQPQDFLQVRHREDRGHSDLYTTFQVMQENHIRGGVSRRDNKGQKHTTREVKSIDTNVKVNRLLWQFAEKMRELKSS